MSSVIDQVFQFVNNGDASYKDKRYSEAETLYQQALALALGNRLETAFIYSSLAKVHKQARQYLRAYELSSLALPTPTAFRDCATCLRKIGNEAKKAQRENELEKVLSDLYQLAVFAYLCYDTHDCKSGVAGPIYDRAKYIQSRLQTQKIAASYKENGRFTRGGLLTGTDHTLFAEVFGETNRVYNPYPEFADLIRQANMELKRYLEAYFRPDEIEFYKGLAPFAFE